MHIPKHSTAVLKDEHELVFILMSQLAANRQVPVLHVLVVEGAQLPPTYSHGLPVAVSHLVGQSAAPTPEHPVP